jgi:hypothetical protein
MMPHNLQYFGLAEILNPKVAVIADLPSLSL